MGRQGMSEIAERHGTPVVYMLTGGLEHLIDKQGGTCRGFSLRSTFEDSLLVIRADFEGKAMVAFVGAATGVHALSTAHRELRNGGLRWRPDRYAKPRKG
jgi:hypothetical protein